MDLVGIVLSATGQAEKDSTYLGFLPSKQTKKDLQMLSKHMGAEGKGWRGGGKGEMVSHGRSFCEERLVRYISNSSGLCT